MLNCEIIRDLIPLYEDGVCSAASRQAVEEHLKTCTECRKLVGIELPQALPETDENEAVLKSGLHKVKRRFRMSIAAVILVVLLAGILKMSWNEFHGQGICLTNLDEILQTGAYAKALSKNDVYTITEALDVEQDYRNIMDLLQKTPEELSAQYLPIHIGDVIWYLQEDSLYVSEEGDPEAFWTDFILNQGWCAMIPEQYVEMLADMEPEMVQRIDEGWYETPYVTLVRTKTPWGAYYVEDALSQQMQDPTKVLQLFCLVPEPVYTDLRDELLQEGQESWDYIHERYGYVENMSEAEYVSSARAAYAQKLTEVLQTCSLDITHYTTAWKSNGWAVEWSGIATIGNEETRVLLSISVRNGKIQTIFLRLPDDIRQNEAFGRLIDAVRYSPTF